MAALSCIDFDHLDPKICETKLKKQTNIGVGFIRRAIKDYYWKAPKKQPSVAYFTNL
jgi:hypothetical protein